MTTKQQYITQAKAANPKPLYATINGEQVQLSDAEYEASIESWAEMRVAQDAHIDQQSAAKESAKAKLAALGLTEAEVNAIIGGV